jgi:hypothetical protein
MEVVILTKLVFLGLKDLGVDDMIDVFHCRNSKFQRASQRQSLKRLQITKDLIDIWRPATMVYRAKKSFAHFGAWIYLPPVTESEPRRSIIPPVRRQPSIKATYTYCSQ